MASKDNEREISMRRAVTAAVQTLRVACAELPPQESKQRLQKLMGEVNLLKKAAKKNDEVTFQTALDAAVGRLSPAFVEVPVLQEEGCVAGGGSLEEAIVTKSGYDAGKSNTLAFESRENRLAPTLSPGVQEAAITKPVAADGGVCLHQLVEITVKRLPDAPAVEWKGSSLSYSALDRCAEAVAGWLSRRGVRRNCIVGIQLDRSLEMVVAIIGSLKSGAAYMPLLPTWPHQQRQFILDDAESQHLITSTGFAGEFVEFKGSLLLFDDCLSLADIEKPPTTKAIVEPSDLAYIIYTSGSTGQPKGVLMHHGGTAGHIARFAGVCVAEGTRYCFSNNYTFDVHVADIFRALSVGGTVVVTRDIFRIPPVDVVSTLPNRIACAKVPQSLKCVAFTGEGITVAAVRSIPPTTRTLNIYGATEFFDACIKEIDRSTFPDRICSIGRPVSSVMLYVMDPHSRSLLPRGTPGELLVGGNQVSRGYIKRPELTAEKFFHAPWSQEESELRVYRTGDLAVCREDGEFEYLGRALHQVELRGHRFDLSTVERAICGMEGVAEAVAVVHTGYDLDGPQLVAYVSPSSATERMKALTVNLPSYMVPSQFIGVDEWPRTSSGKIDRKLLPEPGKDPSQDSPAKKPKAVRKRWMFRDSETADRDSDFEDALVRSTRMLESLQLAASESSSLASAQMDELTFFVRVHAYRRGIVVMNSPLPAPAEIAPMTLLPSPVSAEGLEELVGLGPVFSRLMDAVSCDVPWLLEHLAPLRGADPWLGRLVDLTAEVYTGAGAGRSLISEPRLHLMRQDYLPDSRGRYLQVEINMIAVAFAGLTDHLARLHSDALQTFRPELARRRAVDVMVDNSPGRDFAHGLVAAHGLYCKAAGSGQSDAQICFICFRNDHLEMDQQHIEADVDALGVRCFKAYMTDKFELRGPTNGNCGKLYVKGREVSVVYFHSTFSPEHYSSEVEWENRRTIELSKAIKVPTLPAQLAGTKKVQELLSDQSTLRRFLPERELPRVIAVFAKQFDPSRIEAAAAVSSAVENPEDWVLKPQREGGGNNVHGASLSEKLRTASTEELCQYVLMEKIRSIPVPALLMKGAEVVATKAVSELGIFATLVMRGKEVIRNSVGGAFLRTKDATSAEGGVCVGFGVLDTPLPLRR
eukprot:TRINITY_DN15035_c0_g1_i3.p1 TRINITY_DN15035_c0_g1~~TRINITY_DN15035_c0_g1_i3.p1  ORF type:complete len:1150 (+),score=154.14 TRINITY_DN15035_c0_g1_i3:67-3516(+)